MTAFAAQATGSSDPFESVSNFFDSGLWSFISLTLRVFIVVMWLALVWWTYQDARRRTDNPALIAGAVALAVFLPFLGALVYLTIRPPESMLEVRERELELIALEQRLGDMGDTEGQRIVGRLLGRELGDTNDTASQGMLRQAGIATRDELRDLDLRITELEFRLRNAGRERAERGGDRRPAKAGEPEASSSTEDGGRTMVRRIRRSVSPDPEASG